MRVELFRLRDHLFCITSNIVHPDFALALKHPPGAGTKAMRFCARRQHYNQAISYGESTWQFKVATAPQLDDYTVMHMPADPVAAESRFLSMYMSNGHPETLIAYAKWYGKVEEGISSTEMMAIDSKVSKSYTNFNF